MNLHRIRRRMAVPLLLALVATTACSWSVPADPGLNSRIRGRSSWVPTSAVSGEATAHDPQAADDAGARDVYLRKCSQCHEPVQPTALPAAAWPAMVNKYAPRAGLYGAERRRVLAWLMANAR